MPGFELEYNNPLNLKNKGLLYPVIHPSATVPAAYAATQGQMYYRSASGEEGFWGYFGGTINLWKRFATEDQLGGQNLLFEGDTGDGTVNLSTQTFSIIGTEDEIVTSAADQTLQIGLPDTIKVVADIIGGGDLPHSLWGDAGENDITIGETLSTVVIPGNLTVWGTQTIIDTQTLSVEDPLIELARNNSETDVIDIGIYGNYFDGIAEVVNRSGLFRDASSVKGEWVLFEKGTVANDLITPTKLANLHLAEIILGSKNTELAQTGIISMYNAANNYMMTLRSSPAQVASSMDYVFPVDYPLANDYVLVSSTSGIWAWKNANNLVNQYWSRNSSGDPYLYPTTAGDDVVIFTNETLFFGDISNTEHGSISWNGDGTNLIIDSHRDLWIETTDIDHNVYIRVAGGNKVRVASSGFGLSNSGSVMVDTIETTLTNDNTHIPTSGAIYPIYEYFVNMNEPNGFWTRTTSTISFNDSSREFTIAPVSGSFSFYAGITLRTKNSAQIVSITDTEGLWYFYFNTSGTLVATQTFTTSLITDYALVAVIYWDAVANRHIYLGDERHGINMDSATHLNIHLSEGTKYIPPGLGLGNFTIGNGDLAVHAQFSYESGEILDEDIFHVITGQTIPTSIPVFYLSGSNLWRRITATTFPITTAGTGRAAYNLYSGGSWSLSEVTNNDFVLYHYFAINDPSQGFIAIPGQTSHPTKNSAEAAATTEIYNLFLQGLPFVEFVPIGTVIFQTSNGYANAVKSKIVQTSNGANWIDWRRTKIAGVGSTGGIVTDHGTLVGLGDDDHLQYLLLAGRAGGQTVHGGTADKENLNLYGNSLNTSGAINLYSLPYFHELLDQTTSKILYYDTSNKMVSYGDPPTGGDSLWTEIGLDIYRNSNVGIGNFSVAPSTRLHLIDNSKYIKFSHSGTQAVINAETKLDMQLSGTSIVTLESALVTISQDLKIPINKKLYIGNEDTNGSWRLYDDGSGHLVIEQRISGVWTFAGKFTSE